MFFQKKIPRFSFLDLDGERGEQGGKNFHKFLSFLTSFFFNLCIEGGQKVDQNCAVRV